MRFEAELNKRGVEVVSGLHKKMSLRQHNQPNIWCDVPEAKELAKSSRANFIPFGVLNSAPVGWDDTGSILKGTSWKVCFSTKLVDDIEVFMHQVLPSLIASPTKVETSFEGGPVRHAKILPLSGRGGKFP